MHHRLKTLFLFIIVSTIHIQARAEITMTVHDQLEFQHKESSLHEGVLEIASKPMNKAEFESSEFRDFDPHHVTEPLRDIDKVLVTKSAFFFPNVHPYYWVNESVTRVDYATAAFGLVPTKIDDATMSTVRGFYKQVNVSTNVHFGHCKTDPDYEKHDKEIDMSCEFALKLAQTLKVDRPPELINRTYATSADIKDDKDSDPESIGGTYGFTTYNFYYFDEEKNGTVHISVKVVTFRKEAWYSWFRYKLFSIWSNISGKSDQNQNKGTAESLERISKFIAKEQAQLRAQQADQS